MESPKTQLTPAQSRHFAKLVMEASRLPAVPAPVTAASKDEQARAVAVYYKCELGCTGRNQGHGERCECQNIVLTSAETELRAQYLRNVAELRKD